VQELLQDWLSVWKQDSQPLAALNSTFTPKEQATREAHLGRFLQSVVKELRDRPRTRSECRAAQSRITSAFTCFAKTCLDLGDSHLELLLDDGFSGVATQLARQARHLDRTISAADIFQACRNAWTACALQALMGQPMRLTPSIFAYSMLYPYTDNYLDDPSTSLAPKLAFSGRFRQRLEGQAIAASNEHEATIWRLVEMIEEEYPRNAWPEVYARLLAIHEAQANSVRMLRFDSSPENVDVLRLSFEKGGTSVVADACLVGECCCSWRTTCKTCSRIYVKATARFSRRLLWTPAPVLGAALHWTTSRRACCILAAGSCSRLSACLRIAHFSAAQPSITDL